MRVLVLCTGNSCRSQMAEGILKKIKPEWEVFSAGTEPASAVSRRAISVMLEAGIDISRNTPKSVDRFLSQSFDHVITVCDHANETCPVFLGKVKHRLHIGFEDPSNAIGTDDFIWGEFRRVRDDIKKQFYKFYSENLKN